MTQLHDNASEFSICFFSKSLCKLFGTLGVIYDTGYYAQCLCLWIFTIVACKCLALFHIRERERNATLQAHHCSDDISLLVTVTYYPVSRHIIMLYIYKYKSTHWFSMSLFCTYNTVHLISLHCIASPSPCYITWHCISLHYLSLISLHCIASHHITSHHIART